MISLRVDRDAEAVRATRVFGEPALVVPLDTTVALLDVAGARHRLDRATVALVPARVAHTIELSASGATAIATLAIDAAVRATAVRDYAPHVDARRFSEVIAAPRVLPRTRWVDELIQRFVFEREVCQHPTSKAAKFLEAELAKEVYFLGHEQLAQTTRASVVFEGDAVAARAQAWIEAHLFEPFAIAALARHCGASESTVLRAVRRELGVAPLAYLRRRRLEEALQLLESGRYAVTEVATRVGYDNPSAFAAAFREQFGVAPSQVRVTASAPRLPAHGSRRDLRDVRAAEIDGSAAARIGRGGHGAAMTKLWIALLLAGACSAPTAAPARDPDQPLAAAATDWSTQVIYLAIADRFRDGDPSNNTAAGSCFDPADPHGYHGGDFAGLGANLDYLQSVGATALWITPPNVQAGPAGQCGYHGYWIDYTDPPDDALAPSLGTPDELAALSADLHGAGMRFVLDMVVNHAGDTARITTEHPGWFHDPATCNSQLTCPLDHHPDFAQENPTVAAYLSALEQRAVTRYAVDGIRMDTTMYVPPSYFEDSFFPAVRAANPNIWSVGEIFDEGSTDQFGAYLDAGFNSAFHYPLYAALAAGIGKSGSVDAIASAVAAAIGNLGAARAQSLVLFVDNHDVPRFANLPGYGVPEDEIRKRLLLAT